MGYHVGIVRTKKPHDTSSIEVGEIVSVVQRQFGFEIEYDKSGGVRQLSRTADGEDVVLFYDDGELWTKNPEDNALQLMIEIANALGNGARVRGDEGETYRSVTETYTHQDDVSEAEGFKSALPHWKDIASKIPPVLIAIAFIYVFGKMLVNFLFK